jgi:hypothetical protein
MSPFERPDKGIDKWPVALFSALQAVCLLKSSVLIQFLQNYYKLSRVIGRWLLF